MLFRLSTLEGIRDGTVTLAFRRWRRAAVKPGAAQLTQLGRVRFGAVDIVDPAAITDADARLAGFGSAAALLRELPGTEGDVYRIEIAGLEPDPRIALRETVPGPDGVGDVAERLRRLDAHAAQPWTRRYLEIIRQHPGVRAADICGLAGTERMPFKLNVRKLKALGLTQSLPAGYRLSPRGEAVLDALLRRA